jgi:hypothetical protein
MTIPDSTLFEIMTLDPLKLTADDPRLEVLVAYYRERRHLFNQTGGQAGSTKKVTEKIKIGSIKL